MKLAYLHIFVRRGRRSTFDFRYMKLKILPFMVTNVGKDGTFPAYSCFSTMDSFRFEEIEWKRRISRNIHHLNAWCG